MVDRSDTGTYHEFAHSEGRTTIQIGGRQQGPFIAFNRGKDSDPYIVPLDLDQARFIRDSFEEMVDDE